MYLIIYNVIVSHTNALWLANVQCTFRKFKTLPRHKKQVNAKKDEHCQTQERYILQFVEIVLRVHVLQLLKLLKKAQPVHVFKRHNQ